MLLLLAWPTADVDIGKSPWMPGCSLMHARSGVQAGLFTSGTIGLLIFPFITYVPTSGALGDMLPKVSTWAARCVATSLLFCLDRTYPSSMVRIVLRHGPASAVKLCTP
jgi:hypothetical protein